MKRLILFLLMIGVGGGAEALRTDEWISDSDPTGVYMRAVTSGASVYWHLKDDSTTEVRLIDLIGGVGDHGDLSGLANNDHTQYLYRLTTTTIQGSIAPVNFAGSQFLVTAATTFTISGTALDFNTDGFTINDAAGTTIAYFWRTGGQQFIRFENFLEFTTDAIKIGKATGSNELIAYDVNNPTGVTLSQMAASGLWETFSVNDYYRLQAVPAVRFTSAGISQFPKEVVIDWDGSGGSDLFLYFGPASDNHFISWNGTSIRVADRGVFNYDDSSGSGSFTALSGIVSHGGSENSMGTLIGIQGTVDVAGGTASLNEAHGIHGGILHASSTGMSTNSMSVYAAAPSGFPDKVRNAYSLYAEGPTIGSISNWSGWFDGDVNIAGGTTITNNLYVTGNITAGGSMSGGGDFFNGTFDEFFNALVTSDGTSITMSVEKDGGGDLTVNFSDGQTAIDTTPATTITLTAGTDASPTKNFIYIPQSTKVLTKSTSGWPSLEHARVAYFFVPSAGYVQTNGVYVNQNWNDDKKDSNDQGDLSHIGEFLRLLGARFKSGIDGNGTFGYLTPTASNVELKSTAGVVFQKHEHTVPAFDTSAGGKVLVKNWNGDPYHEITNLFDITDDSGGNSIGNNKFFNLVLWKVVNKTGEFAPTLINLPSGFYSSQSSAEADVSGFDDFTMPSEFNTESSAGFLVARITIKMGNTWTVMSTTDLRGSTPQSARVGGVGATQVDFADNVFRVSDEADNTKKLAFDLGSVATGNTRTLVIPDGDGGLGLFTGLPGGQVIIGGTGSGDSLFLQPTSHATRGCVVSSGTLIAGRKYTTPLNINRDLIVWGDSSSANPNTVIEVVSDTSGVASAIVFLRKTSADIKGGVVIKVTGNGASTASRLEIFVGNNIDSEITSGTGCMTIEENGYVRLGTTAAISALAPLDIRLATDSVTSTSLLIIPPKGPARIGLGRDNGAYLMYLSNDNSDVSFLDNSRNVVFKVDNVGFVTVYNDIKDFNGLSVISFDGAQNMSINGDLTVLGNDIYTTGDMHLRPLFGDKVDVFAPADDVIQVRLRGSSGGLFALKHDGNGTLQNDVGSMLVNNTAAGGTLVFRTVNINALLIDAAQQVGINQKLFHNGDTDTYLQFLTDEVSLWSGGNEMIIFDGAIPENQIVHTTRMNSDTKFYQPASTSGSLVWHINVADAVGGGVFDYEDGWVDTSAATTVTTLWKFPVPQREYFADVVIDSIQVSYYRDHANAIIGGAHLVKITTGAVITEAVSNTTGFTTIGSWDTAEILSGDYTLSTEASYMIKVIFNNASAEESRIGVIIVEAHTE